LISGTGLGFALSPQYQLSMYEKNPMDLGQPDRFLDLRYIDAMIAHHRGAMMLAKQAGVNSRREEIIKLSQEIINNEPKAIDELYQWKNELYSDTNKVKDPEGIILGASNDKFDLRFLNSLIIHHEKGIRMTEEIRSKTTNEKILDNADAVELFLSDGLKMLKNWRKTWYNI